MNKILQYQRVLQNLCTRTIGGTIFNADVWISGGQVTFMNECIKKVDFIMLSRILEFYIYKFIM